MTKYVRPYEQCEVMAMSTGKRCKQRGFILISTGHGAFWCCGNHSKMLCRDYEAAIAIAVRPGEGGRWWDGPTIPRNPGGGFSDF